MDPNTNIPLEKTLSVGCGRREQQPHVIRLDISQDVNPDIVWDLNQYPYPLENACISTIECFDVIEHLENIPRAMEEFHRLLKPGGILKITTPHFSCANSYIDPTHRYHLSYFSFNYFCQNDKLNYYSDARFEISKRMIMFQGNRVKKSILSRFANRFPQTYEQNFAWILPAWFLYFELLALDKTISYTEQ